MAHFQKKSSSTATFLSLPYYSLLFTLLFSSISSRTTPPPVAKTTDFDVVASIRRTKDVLNFESQFQEDDQKTVTSPSSSASFTLSLHPRSSLHKPHYKDYKTLTLARLSRDSARVDSLNHKLNFVLGNYNVSDLKPVQTAIQPEDLQSPVSSGISQGSGEYFTRIGVGTPPKQYYLALDTGSDINWLQCQPCLDCYQQSDPIYNPADSSSYATISCGSPQCSSVDVSSCSVTGNSCLYQVSYGDGSFTVGELVTEMVSFGNSGSVPKVAMGCGHDNEGLFVGSAGLLGLGGGKLSMPSQVKATSFSYCLVDRDSSTSSTVEFNSAIPSGSVTAPLLRNARVPTFFYVGITGISVGGQLLSIPPSVFAINEAGRGGIIVDSGTAITRLTTQAYNALRDSFAKQTTNLPKTTGFAIFDTCYDLSSLATASVPTVAFQFAGGKTLPLHAKDYLIPVDSSGKYCLAFAPTEGSPSIVGNVQQQGTRVSYDLANSVVAFTSDKC